MSTVSHHREPARARGRRPWCTACGTDEYLVIESIQALEPPRTGLVNAAYNCVGCGFFYAHPASVARVAEIVNGPGQGRGVLQFRRSLPALRGTDDDGRFGASQHLRPGFTRTAW